MMLWILLAFLTAAVAAALLIPLLRGNAIVAGEGHASGHAGDIEVYRDQLKEIDRDREQGLIEAEQAEYARAEVGRRLLAAAALKDGEAQAGSTRRKHGLATAIVTIIPPAIGLCLYIMLGSPGLPDQPLEARLAAPGNDIALLVTKAERHLAENPSDGAGWDLLGPIYMRMQRPGDAELAYRNAIRLIGPSSARLTGLGEALMTLSDGVITEDARTSFEAALKLEPDDTRARFYVALGLEQAGKAPEALTAFEEIAKNSPADAPWMPLLSQHIAKNGGAPLAAAAPENGSGAGRAPGGPSQEDVAAADNLSQGDRQQMIRGMVDSLAARLKEEPNNLDGWLRLVRSYAVLGEKDKAGEALNQGLVQFSADANGKSQLLALAGEVGLTAQVQNPAEGAKQ